MALFAASIAYPTESLPPENSVVHKFRSRAGGDEGEAGGAEMIGTVWTSGLESRFRAIFMCRHSTSPLSSCSESQDVLTRRSRSLPREINIASGEEAVGGVVADGGLLVEAVEAEGVEAAGGGGGEGVAKGVMGGAGKRGAFGEDDLELGAVEAREKDMDRDIGGRGGEVGESAGVEIAGEAVAGGLEQLGEIGRPGERGEDLFPVAVVDGDVIIGGAAGGDRAGVAREDAVGAGDAQGGTAERKGEAKVAVGERVEAPVVVEASLPVAVNVGDEGIALGAPGGVGDAGHARVVGERGGEGAEAVERGGIGRGAGGADGVEERGGGAGDGAEGGIFEERAIADERGKAGEPVEVAEGARVVAALEGGEAVHAQVAREMLDGGAIDRAEAVRVGGEHRRRAGIERGIEEGEERGAGGEPVGLRRGEAGIERRPRGIPEEEGTVEAGGGDVVDDGEPGAGGGIGQGGLAEQGFVIVAGEGGSDREEVRGMGAGRSGVC